MIPSLPEVSAPALTGTIPAEIAEPWRTTLPEARDRPAALRVISGHDNTLRKSAPVIERLKKGSPSDPDVGPQGEPAYKLLLASSNVSETCRSRSALLRAPALMDSSRPTEHVAGTAQGGRRRALETARSAARFVLRRAEQNCLNGGSHRVTALYEAVELKSVPPQQGRLQNGFPVVIHADDFGETIGITDGTRRAIEAGILTSTSTAALGKTGTLLQELAAWRAAWIFRQAGLHSPVRTVDLGDVLKKGFGRRGPVSLVDARDAVELCCHPALTEADAGKPSRHRRSKELDYLLSARFRELLDEARARPVTYWEVG